MVYLLDTNVIIRFLVGDDEKFLVKSVEYFNKIESAEIEVEIVDGVLMEAYFVLTKFYKLPKDEILDDLKTILSLDGVVNGNKLILFETLSILQRKNIDFVDALICAKTKLEGYKALSFDSDIAKCQK